MKMVKSLTKANAAKYGIEVREDLNFNDEVSEIEEVMLEAAYASILGCEFCMSELEKLLDL